MENEALVDAMTKELNSLRTSLALTDGALSERRKIVEELKAEMERKKYSEKKLSESNEIQAAQLERANNMIETLRIQILALKGKMQGCNPDDNCRLKAEVQRLDYELRSQRNRTATDEVVMLRSQLRRALEGEETRKRAMDELAVVISEVAMEANQAKTKLASAEQQLRLNTVGSAEAKACKEGLEEARRQNCAMKNTIDQLRVEAEEAHAEFLKCIAKEEDEKAVFREEKNMLVEVLTEVEQTSNKLRDDTNELRSILKEKIDEAESAKAESLELMESLVENEKRLAFFAQESIRLRAYDASDNEYIKERKKLTTSSSYTELKAHCVEEKRKLGHSFSKEKKKKKKTHGAGGGEEKKKKEHKTHGEGEEKEHKRRLPSFSRKEMKSIGLVEEKDHKKAHKSVEEKEQKKLKKEKSMDKDLKAGNSHTKLIICFDPKSMLPIPSVSSSKHKDSSEEDTVTDSIFDIVDTKHKHRRTKSSSEEKSDEEGERGGSHSTKKGVSLRRFGDLWKRKSQSHHINQSHSHSTNNQNQDIHHKEATDIT